MSRSSLSPWACLLLAAGAAAATSCGSTEQEHGSVLNLDRPIDVAIACHGEMRIPGGDGQQVEDPLVFTPMPLEACRRRTDPIPTCDYREPDPNDTCPDPGDADFIPFPWPDDQETLPGQADLTKASRWYIFALQSASGTVAVAETPPVKQAGGGYNPGEISVRDGDTLVPGKNALSVGAEPVAIAGDPSGCYMMTANAGSCDLSVIDVDRVVLRSTEPLVRKLDVTTASGMPLLARPAAMIADQRDSAIGVTCPAQPTGLLYIAYPQCHAVAVVDAATGSAVASIRFDATGTATIGDGNLSCPIECGMRMPIADGGRPVTLDLVRDDVSSNRRLAIGLDNRPVVTVVDLDTSYLPTTVEQYDLEGDVGVVDVAISKVINMTGSDGWKPDISPLRAAQYVYAVATDATVRVVETTTFDHECDVQADPRFVRDVTDARDFICYQPGQVGTPPRRAFARGPGIQLPGDDAPLSVVIGEAGVGKPKSTADPTTLVGYFGFVTSTLGLTYVVNLDDDNYADTQNSTDPLGSELAFAMPHQLRDGVAGRAEQGAAGDPPMGMADHPLCLDDGLFNDTGAAIGGPHADADPTISPNPTNIATVKLIEMPYVRKLHCDEDDGERALPEVMYANTTDVRDQVFPDPRAIPSDETWRFVWEGSLSLDGANDAVDGPAVRSGQLTIGGGSLNVHDAAHPYCAAGVQPFDYVQLRGCDSSQGDRQCGLGETCYVHPDSTISAGACLPTDRIDQLASACRDFLVSIRRYAVQQASSGELVMSERRHVLRTTPIDGCTSVAQCDELADYEKTLASVDHPKDDTTPPSDATWACEPDPTRSPGINRCVETCTASEQCAEGTVCSGGYCIEGTIPPAACVAGLQRYSIHATDAFVAVGNRTGFLHDVVEAPGGQCVKNPMANPLNVGRIPLNPPACTGDGFTDVSPNPCRTTVEHTEDAPNYLDAQTCSLPDEHDPRPKSILRTVQLDAIRWKNPLMTLNLVNTTYPGDAICKFDRGGGRVGIPMLYPGYNFQFHLVAGFKPQIAGSLMVLPTRIIKSPDGVLWIVDEGDSDPRAIDVDNDASNFRGQIMRVDPDGVAAGIVVR